MILIKNAIVTKLSGYNLKKYQQKKKILNPGIILLEGPVSVAKQFLMTSNQQLLNKYCQEQIYTHKKIEFSGISEHSGLLGGKAMHYQTIFRDKNNHNKYREKSNY